MKPHPFQFVRARTVEEALTLLDRAGSGAKVIAGGQSLGPMLNLRLARPSVLVDISGIPALSQTREDDASVTFGACVTHAAIEDRIVADPTPGFMSRVAGGIAYRAVRNRGTIGGSVVHADPSADWLTTLTALDAVVDIAGVSGRRELAMSDFMQMPYTVDLRGGEFVTGIRVPRRSPSARFGYYKFCRKRGEFATAMACVLIDGDTARGVVGATSGKPVLVDAGGFMPVSRGAATAAKRHVHELGLAGDDIEDHLHATAFGRAMAQVVQ